MTRAGLLVAALSLAAPPAVPDPQVFRSGIEVVELDVSVTRGGVPVAGLTAEDFQLTDNGVPQAIESVLLDRVPLSVIMLLDISRSVTGGRLAQLIHASVGVTEALRQDDRAALVTFSHAVNLRVPMTGDMTTIRAALSRIAGDGATALRDAVHMALEIRPRDRSRPLILVFTDGRDSSSWLTDDAVVDTARRIGIVVHAVGVGTDGFLNRVVDAAGGRMWSASSDRQLRDLFSRALDEMRARYVLSYTPRNVRAAGWHELKVKLKNQRADVTARPGYFVAETPSGSSPRR